MMNLSILQFFTKEAANTKSPAEMLEILKGVYRNSVIPSVKQRDFPIYMKQEASGKISRADLVRHYRAALKGAAEEDVPLRERQLNYMIHKRTGGQLPYYDKIKGKGPKDVDDVLKGMRTGGASEQRMYGYSPKATKKVPIVRGGSRTSVEDALLASQTGKAPMFVHRMDHPVLRPGQTKPDSFGLYTYPQSKASSSSLYAHNRGFNAGEGSGAIMVADVPKNQLLYHKGRMDVSPFEMVIPSRAIKRGKLKESFGRTGRSMNLNESTAERIRQNTLNPLDLPARDAMGNKINKPSMQDQIYSIQDKLQDRAYDRMDYDATKGFYPKKGKEHLFDYDPVDGRYEYKLPRDKTIKKYLQSKKKKKK